MVLDTALAGTPLPTDGTAVETSVTLWEGACVGDLVVGDIVGRVEGDPLGTFVGSPVTGDADGCLDGSDVTGERDGEILGSLVLGSIVVGADDGREEGQSDTDGRSEG